jgi:hypothetical protein
MTSAAAQARAAALLAHLAAARADGTCAGADRDVVCSAAFWRGAVARSPAVAASEPAAAAADAAALSSATPWLRIGGGGPEGRQGGAAYASNDYIDWIVADLFFADPWWAGRGTFLETGGSTGVHASTTLFFERYLNFSGLLIEPTPCALCDIPRNRPRAVAVHAALAEAGGEATLSPEGMMASFCPPPHGECAAAPRRPWPPVRAAPLQALMAEAGFANIDFFSLDVEDFGETVLAGIEWGAFAPAVVVIECRSERFCADILRGAGYEVAPTGSVFPTDMLAWRNECP